jgi:hypothetical protein
MSSPTAEELADITLLVAKEVTQLQYGAKGSHVKLFQLWQFRYAGS